MSSAKSVESIGDALHRLTRAIQRRKAQLGAEGEDPEWAAHALLEQIVAVGPMRAAQLAECTFTDPSTVSRHVAALVRMGLVERTADPIDGRASLLVATDEGLRSVSEHRGRRQQLLGELLDTWDPHDCHEFGRLTEKFAVALESQLPANESVSEGTP